MMKVKYPKHMVSIAGTAIICETQCVLLKRNELGVHPNNITPWPDDWPDRVTEQFILDKGFRIYYGTLEEYTNMYYSRINDQTRCEIMVDTHRQYSKLKSNLTNINRHIENAKKRCLTVEQEITDRQRRLDESRYPIPSRPQEIITLDDNDKIPEACGCYFAWESDLVRYVGRAVNLKTRLRPGHHAILPTHSLSWVEVDPDDLYFAEAYYIGMLRPRLNKGKPTIQRTES